MSTPSPPAAAAAAAAAAGSIRDRIAARKKKLEDLKKAREAFSLSKVNEDAAQEEEPLPQDDDSSSSFRARSASVASRGQAVTQTAATTTPPEPRARSASIRRDSDLEAAALKAQLAAAQSEKQQAEREKQEALAQLAAMRDSHPNHGDASQISALMAELQAAKAAKAEAEAELQRKQEEWAQIGQLLLGAAVPPPAAANGDGSAAGGGASATPNFDLGAILEEHAVFQEENNELQLMLQESLTEVETLRAQVVRTRSAQDYLEEALAQSEEENKTLVEELNLVRDKHKRSSGTLDVEVRDLRIHLMEAQQQLEQLNRKLNDATSSGESYKQRATQAEAVVEDLRRARQQLEEEVEKLTARLDETQRQLTVAQDNLHKIAEDSQNEGSQLRAELEQQKALASQASLAAQQMKNAVVNEAEASRTSRQEQEQEMILLRGELDLARKEAEATQAQMESLLAAVKMDLAKSEGNAEMAALAGLSLTELVEKLKQERAAAIQRAEQQQAACEEALAKLAEREALLGRVMEHLQTMNGAAGGHEGEDPLTALHGQLERAARERQDLLATLEQHEADAEALSAKLANTQAGLEEEARRRRELESALHSRTEELDATAAKLAEREAMLTQVMSFLKSNGASGNGDGQGVEFEQDTDKLMANTAALKQAVEEQMALAAAERERLKAQLAQQAALIESLQKELAALRKSSGDERDELQARVASLEADLQAKTAELQALQDEFAAISDNMRAAAEAGLTLTEMLNRMRAEHEAAIGKLELENRRLREQIADYEARLQRLRDLLPGGEGEGDIDLIEQLKLRLEQALAAQQQMEAMMKEVEEELAAKLAALKAVTDERDKLLVELKGLRAEIAELQGQLQLSQAELSRLKDLLGRAKDLVHTLQGKDGDADDENPASSTAAMDALLRDLEASLQRITMLEARIRDQDQQIGGLQAQLVASHQKAADLQTELDAARAELKLANLQLATVMRKIEALQNELEKSRQQVEDLLEVQRIDRQTITRQQALIDELRAALDAMMNKRYNNVVQSDDEMAEKCRKLQNELEAALRDLDEIRKRLEHERNFFRQKYLSKWRQNTSECESCGLDFSVFTRRHHCRLCGLCFCDSCCSDRVQTAAQKKPARVCRDCYDFINEIEFEESEKKSKSGSPGKPADGGTDAAAAAAAAAAPKVDRSKPREVVLERSEKHQTLGLDLNIAVEEGLVEKGVRRLKVEVSRIIPGGLADSCGLRIGDIVLTVNGKPVVDQTREDVIVSMRKNPVILGVMAPTGSGELKTSGLSQALISAVRERLESDASQQPSPQGSPSTGRRAKPKAPAVNDTAAIFDSESDLEDDKPGEKPEERSVVESPQPVEEAAAAAEVPAAAAVEEAKKEEVPAAPPQVVEEAKKQEATVEIVTPAPATETAEEKTKEPEKEAKAEEAPAPKAETPKAETPKAKAETPKAKSEAPKAKPETKAQEAEGGKTANTPAAINGKAKPAAATTAASPAAAAASNKPVAAAAAVGRPSAKAGGGGKPGPSKLALSAKKVTMLGEDSNSSSPVPSPNSNKSSGKPPAVRKSESSDGVKSSSPTPRITNLDTVTDIMTQKSPTPEPSPAATPTPRVTSSNSLNGLPDQINGTTSPVPPAIEESYDVVNEENDVGVLSADSLPLPSAAESGESKVAAATAPAAAAAAAPTTGKSKVNVVRKGSGSTPVVAAQKGKKPANLFDDDDD